MTGPYNTHFIRDVGILYAVTAAGFVWGLGRGGAKVLLFASVWPALHAIYHLNMWAGRGFAFDTVALVNAVAIQAPAWITLFVAFRLQKPRGLGS